MTVESNEAEYILEWVERGNTLILVDEGAFTRNALFGNLHTGTESLGDRVTSAPLSQPIVDSTIGAPQIQTFDGLEMERADFVTFIEAEGKPILARVPHGKGIVWLASAPDLFTNQNLGDENNAKLAAACSISQVPRGSVVTFDEYHLGFVPEFSDSFFQVLYDVPWGWGVPFSLVLVFVYLGLNGQRLGKVLPVPKSLACRSPSEYVTSMANLFRRANKRGMVLQHYRHSLKRRLGRPYHLNPELSDERYIEMLTRLRPDLERHELVDILNSLRRTDTTEADLVKTVERSVTFGGRTMKTAAQKPD